MCIDVVLFACLDFEPCHCLNANMQRYLYNRYQLEPLQGKVAILKAGLAYGRTFLSRCMQAYSPFIHCCDAELMSMDSGSDSVWAKHIHDVSEDSDIDDY